MSLRENNPRLGLPSVLSAPVVGFIAGMLTLYLMHFWSMPILFWGNPFLGLPFGGLFGIHLWIFKKIRVWQVIPLTLASAGAYAVALMCFGYPATLLSRFQPPGAIVAPLSLFLPGMLGAFAILGAVYVLIFRNQKWWVILGKAFLWAIGGGVLAVLGWSLGSSVGPKLISLANYLHIPPPSVNGSGADPILTPDEYSLHVLWQTGMGMLLALSLALTKKTSTEFPRVLDEERISPLGRRSFPATACIFYVAILLPLINVASTRLHSEIQSDEEFAKCIQAEPPVDTTATTPSRQDEQRPVDALVIKHDIGPYAFRVSGEQKYQRSEVPYGSKAAVRHIPPTVLQNVYYERSEIAKFDTSALASYVVVVEYPTPEWATYALTNNPDFCAQAYEPGMLRYRTKVSRFGQAIIMYAASRGRDWDFYWAAGDKLINIHYNFPTVPENDLLLEAYLKKYPSSVAP